MSSQPDEAVSPSNTEDLKQPSPYNPVQATVTQNDGTRWIFYYNIHNHLHYTKIPPKGSSVQVQLLINNKPVIGKPQALAATRHVNSPRVFWIDPTQHLHEANLQGTTGDRWAEGNLSTKNWHTYVNSGLSAEGDNSSLPSGVTVRVLFHESAHFPLFSQADYGNSWTKVLNKE